MSLNNKLKVESFEFGEVAIFMRHLLKSVEYVADLFSFSLI